MKEQIENMKKLGMTDEEIADILECDKRIDKGEKLFELAETEKGNSRKARQVARMPKPQTNREKKIDIEKRFLIQCMGEIAENLADSGTIEVVNPEKEIVFVYKDRKFKIVLSCPRS
jgi:hypothetical protein